MVEKDEPLVHRFLSRLLRLWVGPRNHRVGGIGNWLWYKLYTHLQMCNHVPRNKSTFVKRYRSGVDYLRRILENNQTRGHRQARYSAIDNCFQMFRALNFVV